MIRENTEREQGSQTSGSADLLRRRLEAAGRQIFRPIGRLLRWVALWLGSMLPFRRALLAEAAREARRWLEQQPSPNAPLWARAMDRLERFLLGCQLRFASIVWLQRGLLCAVVVPPAVLVTLLYFPPGAAHRAEQFEKLVDFRTNVAVVDADANLIGSTPIHGKRPAEVTYRDRAGSLLYTDDVPRAFKDMLRAREDRFLHFGDGPSLSETLSSSKTSWKDYVGAKLHIRGISTASLMAVVLGREGGGSSLCQQLIKGLKTRRTYARRYPSSWWLQTLSRKVDEVLTCASIWEDLSAHGGEEFWQHIAASMPFAQYGRITYGLRDSAALLFGKPVDALTDGELAILAGSTWRQVQFAEKPIGGVRPENRWDVVLRNARKGARLAYADSQPARYRRILAELRGRLSEPPDHIILPREARGTITQEERKEFDTLAKRYDLVMQSSRPRVRSTIDRLAHGHLRQDEQINEIRLTINWPQNHVFKRRLTSALEPIDHLDHALVPSPSDDRRRTAKTRVLVTDADGGIVLNYRMGRRIEREPIGSLAKPLALLPILRRLDADPASEFCNRFAGGLTNAGGPRPEGVHDCRRRRTGSHFSLEETMARSLNLPMYEALRRADISSREWTDFYEDFGLAYDSERPMRDIPSTELASGLAFGHALGGFHRLHNTIAQLYAVADTPPAGQIPCVSTKIASSARITNRETGHSRDLSLPPKPSCKARTAISRWLGDDPTARRSLWRLLSTPVRHSKGTLRFVDEVARRHGVGLVFGKTGTSMTASGRTRGKWLSLRVRLPGGAGTFDITAAITASDRTVGLGENVSMSRLMTPALDEVLRALSEGPRH